VLQRVNVCAAYLNYKVVAACHAEALQDLRLLLDPGFVLAVVWSFVGTQDPARRRLARAYLIRALVVAGLVILFVAVAAMVFTAALHSSSWPTTITVEEAP